MFASGEKMSALGEGHSVSVCVFATYGVCVRAFIYCDSLYSHGGPVSST